MKLLFLGALVAAVSAAGAACGSNDPGGGGNRGVQGAVEIGDPPYELLVEVGGYDSLQIVRVPMPDADVSQPYELEVPNLGEVIGGVKMLVRSDEGNQVVDLKGGPLGYPFVVSGDSGWNPSGTRFAAGLDGGGMVIMDGDARETFDPLVKYEDAQAGDAPHPGMGELTYFEWLDDDHLLLGDSNSSTHRIATLDEEELRLGPALAGEPNWIADPGTDLVLDRTTREFLRVDVETGKATPVASLAEVDIDPTSQASWAPTGGRILVGEGENRPLLCSVEETLECREPSGMPSKYSFGSPPAWTPDGSALAIVGGDTIFGDIRFRTFVLEYESASAHELLIPECERPRQDCSFVGVIDPDAIPDQAATLPDPEVPEVPYEEPLVE